MTKRRAQKFLTVPRKNKQIELRILLAVGSEGKKRVKHDSDAYLGDYFFMTSMERQIKEGGLEFHFTLNWLPRAFQ
jgi:hypothetical protein